jgi:hypothetical protein
MNGVNAPFGFTPVRKLDGSAWSVSQNQYYIASGYNTAIFTGDPVTMLSDGTIGIGVAGSPCLGIFAGCKYYSSTPDSSGHRWQFKPNWVANTTVPAGTVVEALVIDDPNTVFSAQETNGSGAAGTPLALADRNLNINFLIGSGNAATGQSTSSINNASEADTATLNMKILDLAPFPAGTNPVGSFAVWLVTWNNHLFKGGAGTTGI